MNFKENLKQIRKENNLSQEQLAEQLGVSRQSVSKWESGQAYPEMDKMVQLCQIFDLNIDELLNHDMNNIKKNKQSKININKYIDDFLEYVTKTIDMFSSMKIKQRLKCLFEQLIVIGGISLILLILGLPLSSIFHSIFSFIPHSIYYSVYNIFSGIYLLISIIIVIIFTLHIFKVRYLDYYEIIKKDEIKDEQKQVDNDSNKELDKKSKIILEKKQEKIIIRDPKHSEYKFISGLIKGLLIIIKAITSIFSLFFCFLLVILVIGFVCSFLIIENCFLFIGVLLSIIGLIVINLIILNILYNFIINKKNNKKLNFIIFISSLIFTSIGIGVLMIGITQFDYIEDIEKTNLYVVQNEEIKMTDDILIFNYYGNIKYVESNDENIKVEIIKSEYSNFDINNYGNGYHFENYFDDAKTMDFVRKIIKDISSEKIIDYGDYKISLYTKKENIDKIKENLQNYYKQEQQFDY